MDEIEFIEKKMAVYQKYNNAIELAAINLKQDLKELKPLKRLYIQHSKEHEYIKKAVLAAFEVEWKDIQSIRRKRHKNIYPRQMYIYLMNLLTKNTLESIGANIRKGYDHSTVYHSVQTIDTLLDPTYGEKFVQDKYQEIKMNLFSQYNFNLNRFVY